MKKIIPVIALAPFVVVTIYYVIEKYIYFLFDIKDVAGASFVAVMLTLLTSTGIGLLILNLIIDEKVKL